MNKILNETMQILLRQKPDAQALIRGSKEFPEIMGEIAFYPLWRGSLVITSISGLPKENEPCLNRFHGFHIHEGIRCSGNEADPFADTGRHWNPQNCPHPSEAGDFPVLLANDGYAMGAFYTDRFFPEEVIGKTIILHEMSDDFRSQPSGESGNKIACGQIVNGKN